MHHRGHCGDAERKNRDRRPLNDIFFTLGLVSTALATTRVFYRPEFAERP